MSKKTRARRRPKARRRRRLSVPFWTAFGAAIMYLFDPRDGKRRRAVARDRTAGAVRDLRRKADKRARYMEGKAHGFVHEIHGEQPKPDMDDATLKHKIESEVLRDHDGPINVSVANGVAELRGTLRRPEDIRRLEQDVSRVPGVLGVDNRVHLPKTQAS